MYVVGRASELVQEGKLRTVRLTDAGWYRFRVEDVERLIGEGKDPPDGEP